jgi:hypothetical protein
VRLGRWVEARATPFGSAALRALDPVVAAVRNAFVVETHHFTRETYAFRLALTRHLAGHGGGRSWLFLPLAGLDGDVRIQQMYDTSFTTTVAGQLDAVVFAPTVPPLPSAA